MNITNNDVKFGATIALATVVVLQTQAAVSHQIHGTIVDKQTQEPLIGATITAKESKAGGVITDFNGNFSLQVSEELPLTLKVSYIGYQDQEIEIYDDSEPIAIQLSENLKSLTEIVVTASGAERKSDELGSTTSVIPATSIQKAGTSTLINALAGKASGVRIQSPNGEAGSGSNIIVRGVNTFIGNSQPLIILDGAPISNETSSGTNVAQTSRLNDLNASDIASLQVLKGASAAALYGSRASNGVIVITTKEGERSKRPQITYGFSHSIDWIGIHHPIQSTYGQGTGGKWNKGSNFSWGDKIADRSGEEDVLDQSGAYFIAESGKIYYPIKQKNSRETYTDSNFDAVFGRGGFNQHDLSISGGNDKGSYFLSYGGLFQDGVARNSGYNKHNVRLNATYTFAPWIKTSSKFSFNSTSTHRVNTNGDTVNGAYLSLLRNPADFDITDYKGTYVDAKGVGYPNRQRMYRNEIGANKQPTYNNPLWSTNEQKDVNRVTRFIYTPELIIEPVRWANLTLRGGVDYYTSSTDSYYPINSGYKTFSSGYYSDDVRSRRELNFDALLRFHHSFTDQITASATLGYGINDRYTNGVTGVISAFDVDSELQTSALSSNASNTTWTKVNSHTRVNRGFFILDVALWDQLFITASGTEEAASTVSGTYFYPSADVAWQFTKMLPENEILSFGKLRASWGKVGTEPAAYKEQTYAVSANTYYGGGYAVSSSKGNENLKPEVKTEWELGADLRLFSDRASVKFTYYQSKIKDLLFNVSLNPSSGYSSLYANAGSMENKGIELDLGYDVFRTKDFTWTANLNFNKNENLVTSIAGTGTLSIGGSSYAIEGYPVGVLYRPGSLKDANGNLVLDKNGFPQVDTSGSQILGDPNPEWRGGAGMDFNYKGLELSFLFEHSHGGAYLNRTQLTLYGFGTHQDVSHEVTLDQDLVNYKGQVFKAGTTVRGNIGDFGGGKVLLDEAWYNGIGGGLGTSKVNDLYVQDNTWTKLRNVTLAYTWSNRWLRTTAHLRSIRFNITGRDLLCWTNLVGIDPESNNYGVSNAQGMDYFSSPATRSVLFGIQINY